MPSSTLSCAISCFLLSTFFILAAAPDQVSAWNGGYHPDHKGKYHPDSDIKLPDWPPYLPNWLSKNHTCYPTYDYIRDATKINVLFVANSFCTEVAFYRTNQSRPMEPIIRFYNTNLYYQKKEDSIYNNKYTVLVEDMGEDCRIQSSADLDVDGFASKSEPYSTSRQDYINVLQPLGSVPENGLRYANLCTQILYNAWAQCNVNEGRGGRLAVEAGCVTYSIEPTQAQNHMQPKCPEQCITPVYRNKTEKAAGRPIPEITPKDWRYGTPSHP